ncbi:proteasome-activating nucleotidase [Slackia heliotrinireducens]|uniref:AAA+ family ATPase n=1 Tax=Slackia heliotrinireducens (strain ATCC 29202 / DSM 20476 / NCTC 11029 / RHS 1) TaxID=471855 RepID=C7N1N5_SLAHD|nr:AAA family ATPase [Slackia heliotrinireducens]ACV21327.1 AAA+ family ATPase [Slackia heliotrinireducens DSM 20476]VEG98762.1 proteasome-activating nucleotidase [Slackia heliotrinireducens]
MDDLFSMDLPEYCAGKVRFPQDTIDWASVVLACDLLVGSGAKVLFGRACIQDGTAVLPFAAKESAEEAIRKMFDGCQVSCAPLKINFSDKKALQVATRINAVNPKTDKTSLAAIKPQSESGLLEHGFIGLDKQVKTIMSIVEAIGAYGRDAVDSLHMMFVGPPGGGKTMVARALLELYDRKGVTSGKGVFVNASATDLISPYVGETSHFVRKTFESACGGILFIDEAYRLSRNDPTSRSADHGQEAIDAINQLMEELRQEVIVIFAGYPDEMEDFLKHNPGLKGRIGFEVRFDGYGSADLLSIFGKMANDRGFAVEKDALDVLEQHIPSLSKQEGFANARTMRKLLDHVVTNKAQGKLDRCLSAGDVERALADDEFRSIEKLRVGFVG